MEEAGERRSKGGQEQGREGAGEGRSKGGEEEAGEGRSM